jgi:hypothetical protein
VIICNLLLQLLGHPSSLKLIKPLVVKPLNSRTIRGTEYKQRKEQRTEN